jgi:hypothetical protein
MSLGTGNSRQHHPPAPQVWQIKKAQKERGSQQCAVTRRHQLARPQRRGRGALSVWGGGGQGGRNTTTSPIVARGGAAQPYSRVGVVSLLARVMNCCARHPRCASGVSARWQGRGREGKRPPLLADFHKRGKTNTGAHRGPLVPTGQPTQPNTTHNPPQPQCTYSCGCMQGAGHKAEAGAAGPQETWGQRPHPSVPTTPPPPPTKRTLSGCSKSTAPSLCSQISLTRSKSQLTQASHRVGGTGGTTSSTTTGLAAAAAGAASVVIRNWGDNYLAMV